MSTSMKCLSCLLQFGVQFLPPPCPVLSYHFTVELKGTETGGIVRCDQPTALDISVRNADYIETLRGDILEEVMARVQAIFE